MSEKTEEQIAAAQAAMRKMAEGVQDWLDAVADPGEPEICENAVVMFEAKGMADHGLFYRRQYLFVESNGCTSQMLGMLDLVGDELQHALRCSGGHEG